MILAPNGGFAEWGEVFGDTVIATALLDRLLHQAIVVRLEGASYRLRGHADRQPGSSGSRHVPQHETPTRQTAKNPHPAAHRNNVGYNRYGKLSASSFE
jgi:hypothetical protein